MAKKANKPLPDPRVESIMRDFNFNVVENVMHYTGWTWATSKSPTRTPTRREIRKTARELLKHLVEEKNLVETRGGGFVAQKNSDGVLELSFQLEMAQGFPPDYQEE